MDVKRSDHGHGTLLYFSYISSNFSSAKVRTSHWWLPGDVRKRFGTLEVSFPRNQHDSLKTLADYVINQRYSHLRDAGDVYAQFFSEVIDRTACLIAQRQTIRLGALGQAAGR